MRGGRRHYVPHIPQLMRLLARVAHACIEGSIFVYTSPGQSRVAPALLAASRQHIGYSSPCTPLQTQGEHSAARLNVCPTSVTSNRCCKTSLLCRLQNLFCCPKCCAALVCGTKAVCANSMQSSSCMLCGKRSACVGWQWPGGMNT